MTIDLTSHETAKDDSKIATPATVTRRFLSTYPEGMAEAIKFANPNARISTSEIGDDGYGVVSVTVEVEH